MKHKNSDFHRSFCAWRFFGSRRLTFESEHFVKIQSVENQTTNYRLADGVGWGKASPKSALAFSKAALKSW